MSDEKFTEDNNSSRVSKISKAELEALKNGGASASVKEHGLTQGKNPNVSKISKEELNTLKETVTSSDRSGLDTKTRQGDNTSVADSNRDANKTGRSQMDEAKAYLMSLLGEKQETRTDETSTEEDADKSSDELTEQAFVQNGETEVQSSDTSGENVDFQDSTSESEDQQGQENNDNVEPFSNSEMEELLDIGEKAKLEASKQIPNIKDVVAKKDELEIKENDGKYTSNLDFTKNMSVRRYKLPLPKLPFIIIGVSVVLVALIVSIVMIVQNNKPPEPVTIVSVKLNASVIDGGYIGDEVDLRGLYIECKYSDGSTNRVYNIDDYIKSYSEHFDASGVILSEGNVATYDNATIIFEYEGNSMTLKANTYEKRVIGVKSVSLAKDVFVVGDIISYEDILVIVDFERLGSKVPAFLKCKTICFVNLKVILLSQATMGL